MTPAYDLRSNAKIKGNRPYLPPNYAVLMHLGYAAMLIFILVALGYFGWGIYLNWQLAAVKARNDELDRQVKAQDQMLWLADWRSTSLPVQELLVEFFASLPPDVRLSQMSMTHLSNEGAVDLRIAINSDRNTSAQYFRDMINFFQSKGLAIQNLEQNTAVGATVFQAKFRIMHKIDSAPASAPAVEAAPNT